jgi:hypothetical protein
LASSSDIVFGVVDPGFAVDGDALDDLLSSATELPPCRIGCLEATAAAPLPDPCFASEPA